MSCEESKSAPAHRIQGQTRLLRLVRGHTAAGRKDANCSGAPERFVYDLASTPAHPPSARHLQRSETRLSLCTAPLNSLPGRNAYSRGPLWMCRYAGTGRGSDLSPAIRRVSDIRAIAWPKYRSRQAKPADPGLPALSPSRTVFAAPSIIAWVQGPEASPEIGDPALRGGGHDATDTPDSRTQCRRRWPGRMSVGSAPFRRVTASKDDWRSKTSIKGSGLGLGGVSRLCSCRAPLRSGIIFAWREPPPTCSREAAADPQDPSATITNPMASPWGCTRRNVSGSVDPCQV